MRQAQEYRNSPKRGYNHTASPYRRRPFRRSIIHLLRRLGRAAGLGRHHGRDIISLLAME